MRPQRILRAKICHHAGRLVGNTITNICAMCVCVCAYDARCGSKGEPRPTVIVVCVCERVRAIFAAVSAAHMHTHHTSHTHLLIHTQPEPHPPGFRPHRCRTDERSVVRQRARASEIGQLRLDCPRDDSISSALLPPKADHVRSGHDTDTGPFLHPSPSPLFRMCVCSPAHARALICTLFGTRYAEQTSMHNNPHRHRTEMKKNK